MMPVSAHDRELLADMRQREFELKKGQRATHAVRYELRRYRWILAFVVAVVVAVIAAILVLVESLWQDWSDFRRPALVFVGVCAVFGLVLGRSMLRTGPGRQLLAKQEIRLHRKYSGDLHAVRRWMRFWYQGEDISDYVPQILYFIDSEHRFDSVRAALDFAKRHSRESPEMNVRGLGEFNSGVAQTNQLIVSSVDEAGHPSIRVMSFVTTDRPGRWYVTTAPESPKVHEFERGHLAVITPPTDAGVTVSSNRVEVRRVGKTFDAVADLYRAQVPGYADSMAADDQRHELVYELTLRSAKVDSWLEHHWVAFD